MAQPHQAGPGGNDAGDMPLLGRLTFSWGRRRMRFVTAQSLRAGRGKPASGGVLMADG
jgi:hypothetical protein